MILKKDQKTDIAKRIEFIKIQFNDLQKFADLNWETYNQDRDVQRNIERLAENVANAAIDVSKIILVGEEVELPNSYRDVILKLAVCNILDKNLAEKIADYAQLRNILAHQYLDIKWDRIKIFIKSAAADFNNFISQISRKL